MMARFKCHFDLLCPHQKNKRNFGMLKYPTRVQSWVRTDRRTDGHSLKIFEWRVYHDTPHFLRGGVYA